MASVGAQFTTRNLEQLRSGILAWYDANRRELPWRKDCDSYKVWVSEIMLQQTQVAVVAPRYERFLGRFPSVEKLASAKLEAVLAEWSGLGYYHRARNLHSAAQVIAQGGFPASAAEWRKLPGVGQYTAAAVASIAFGEPVAVVDGNVERVLGRVLGREVSKKEAWETAQKMLDLRRPGDFNQGMMELGATVCTPSSPKCAECPIRRHCRTRGHLKLRKTKGRSGQRQVFHVLVVRGGSILLVKRKASDRLMPGMWELPAAKASRRREILFNVRHSITSTNYLISVVEQTHFPRSGGRWVRISRLQQLPLTGLAKKILLKANVIQ
jgi:A/G-specific adenine glycosylase